jgi:hypothetical protein
VSSMKRRERTSHDKEYAMTWVYKLYKWGHNQVRIRNDLFPPQKNGYTRARLVNMPTMILRRIQLLRVILRNKELAESSSYGHGMKRMRESYFHSQSRVPRPHLLRSVSRATSVTYSASVRFVTDDTLASAHLANSRTH